MKKANKQERAIQIIRKVGGNESYDFEFASKDYDVYDKFRRRGPRGSVARPWPKWLRSWLGDHFFDRLVEIDFSETDVTDEELKELSELLPDVRTLWLFRTKISDEGLKYLVNLPHLARLSLAETGVTDEGLSYVGKCENLQELHVRDTLVTSEGIGKHLRRLRNLHGYEHYFHNVD